MEHGDGSAGPEDWRGMVESTIGHYDQNAASFWAGTKDHDVSQNREALLTAMGHPLEGTKGTVLDLGCGPGRDIAHFLSLGLKVTGLDASKEFVRMAREHTGAEVLHQDFHRLELPASYFHGIFANASLFHVYRPHLPAVLSSLHDAMIPGGILFSSNPRADEDTENFSGRYGYYMCYETYAALMRKAGFEEVGHFYRPSGKPRHLQPWLASTWRKPR
ncbi:tam [Symbiodinium natans]|uniref:Tam protein n=1 Tax=Symbiodinium natans TaxID=878477 RepID=A0A812S6J7_9DINO|nr:tam [Symbiodinium natans]